MNRTIKLVRTSDPVLSIRIEIYGSPHGVTGTPIEVLNLTTEEADELEQMFAFFRDNVNLASITITTRPRQGGAS